MFYVSVIAVTVLTVFMAFLVFLLLKGKTILGFMSREKRQVRVWSTFLNASLISWSLKELLDFYRPRSVAYNVQAKLGPWQYWGRWVMLLRLLFLLIHSVYVRYLLPVPRWHRSIPLFVEQNNL
jgi:hypothetical protein